MAPLLLLLLAQSPEDTSLLERRMAELINVEREARGLEPLKSHPELAAIARRYSAKMAAAGRVSHELDGSVENRIREALPYTCLFGENVSKHTHIDYSLGDLLASEGHRQNLLHPEYETIGVGIVRGRDGFLYITQEFARPCPRRR